jgi:hypothetical protein
MHRTHLTGYDIVAPTTAPVVSEHIFGGPLPNDKEYKYRITFATSYGETEVSPVSDMIRPRFGAVELSALEVSPSVYAVRRNIYRSENGGPFYLLDVIDKYEDKYLDKKIYASNIGVPIDNRASSVSECHGWVAFNRPVMYSIDEIEAVQIDENKLLKSEFNIIHADENNKRVALPKIYDNRGQRVTIVNDSDYSLIVDDLNLTMSPRSSAAFIALDKWKLIASAAINSDYAVKLGEINAFISNTVGEISTLKIDNSILKASVGSLQSDGNRLTAINSELSVVKTDISTLKSRVSTTENNISANNSEISMLKNRVAALETHTTSLESTISSIGASLETVLANSGSSVGKSYAEFYSVIDKDSDVKNGSKITFASVGVNNGISFKEGVIFLNAGTYEVEWSFNVVDIATTAIYLDGTFQPRTSTNNNVFVNGRNIITVSRDNVSLEIRNIGENMVQTNGIASLIIKQL